MKKTYTTLRMATDTRDRLKVLAALRRSTMADLIELACDRFEAEQRQDVSQGCGGKEESEASNG